MYLTTRPGLSVGVAGASYLIHRSASLFHRRVLLLLCLLRSFLPWALAPAFTVCPGPMRVLLGACPPFPFVQCVEPATLATVMPFRGTYSPVSGRVLRIRILGHPAYSKGTQRYTYAHCSATFTVFIRPHLVHWK